MEPIEFFEESKHGAREDLLPKHIPQDSVESQKAVFRRAPQAALNLTPAVIQNRFRKMMSEHHGLIVARTRTENPKEAFTVILDLQEKDTIPSEESLRNAVKMWPELGRGFVYRPRTGGPSPLQQAGIMFNLDWVIYPVSRYGMDVVNAYLDGRYDPNLIKAGRFESINVFFTGNGFGISGDFTYLKQELIEAGCEEKKLRHPYTGKTFSGLSFKGGSAKSVRNVLIGKPAYNAVIWF